MKLIWPEKHQSKIHVLEIYIPLPLQQWKNNLHIMHIPLENTPIPRHLISLSLSLSRWTTFLKKHRWKRSSSRWQDASQDFTYFSVAFSANGNVSQRDIVSDVRRLDRSRSYFGINTIRSPCWLAFLTLKRLSDSENSTRSSDHIGHLSPQPWGLHVPYSQHSRLVSANVAGFHMTFEGACKTEVREYKQLFTLSWPSNFHKPHLSLFFASKGKMRHAAVNRKTFRWNSKKLPFLGVLALKHPSLPWPYSTGSWNEHPFILQGTINFVAMVAPLQARSSLRSSASRFWWPEPRFVTKRSKPPCASASQRAGKEWIIPSLGQRSATDGLGWAGYGDDPFGSFSHLPAVATEALDVHMDSSDLQMKLPESCWRDKELQKARHIEGLLIHTDPTILNPAAWQAT